MCPDPALLCISCALISLRQDNAAEDNHELHLSPTASPPTRRRRMESVISVASVTSRATRTNRVARIFFGDSQLIPSRRRPPRRQQRQRANNARRNNNEAVINSNANSDVSSNEPINNSEDNNALMTCLITLLSSRLKDYDNKNKDEINENKNIIHSKNGAYSLADNQPEFPG